MSTVAQFSVEHVQYLNQDSVLSQDAPSFAKEPENLIYLYQQMVKTRSFDTKAINLQRTGKMGTYASCLGQEAVFVGYGHAMQQTDVLVPYYRDYGAQFQRGVKMAEVLRYWGGDERGNDFAECREDFSFSVPIASQLLHATGVAHAFKYRQQARAVVTTCGEGGTSEGDFYEAINLAGDWHLPVVFVVNNNQWAISVPRNIQTGAQTIAQKAIAAGIPGIQVDGNDVIAMREVADQALTRARNGEGPTLIEAITYRLCDHTTADDASRYRPKEELDLAWQQEPIKRLRTYLTNNNIWDDSKEQVLQSLCSQEVEQAVADYLATPKQPSSAMFDYLYAELPEAYQQQRDSAKEFGGEHG